MLKRVFFATLLLATPGLAEHPPDYEHGSLPTCNADRKGRIFTVTDSTATTTCGAGGSSVAPCLCDGSSWVSLPWGTPGADEVLESMLKAVDTAADEECLTYETTTGDFEWQTCGGAGFTPDADPGVDHSSYVAGHADGTNCSAGEIPLGVDASGASQGCYEPTEADITDLSHTTDTNLTQEEVEDFAGAVVATGGTKTGITVTYQDATGDMDFVLDSLAGDVSGTLGAMSVDNTKCVGTSSYLDGDGGCDGVSGDVTGQLSALVVGDDSHAHTTTTISGLVEADITDLSHTTDTTLSQEQVEDFVGGMVTGNTETDITVTYQDADGTLDFVVTGGGGGHSDGANCAAGEIPLGVDASGAVQGCYEPSEADISDLSHTTDTNLTEEEVEDFVGGMLGGTETQISVTYQDGTNDIDFVVDSLGGDVTGTLASNVVGDDSHAHTSSTISGLDISDDTNLTAGDSLTLTGDEVSFGGFPTGAGGAVSFTTSFACPMNGTACGNTTNGDQLERAPMTGTLSDMRIDINTAPGTGSDAWTVTVTVNNVNTSLTCTISTTATSCSDLVNTASVTAGDNWGVEFIESGTAASAGAASWTFKFVPD